MAEYILIGAEGKEEKISETQSARTGQGLYCFPWGHHNLFASKSKPDLELIVTENSKPQKRTPRLLKSVGEEIYVLTKSHLKKLPVSEIVSSSVAGRNEIIFTEAEALDKIFSAVSNEQRFQKIIGKNTTNACIEKTAAGTFLALFNYDNLKMSSSLSGISPGRNLQNSKEAGGYLFRLDTKSGSPELLPDFHPTGDLVATASTLLVACGSALLQLLLPSMKVGANSYPVAGNILSVSHREQNILLTDNEEGYLLITNGNSSGARYQKSSDFVYFRENGPRQHLPSEATSALLMSYQSKANPDGLYAFFGCDEGKLLVYEIQQGEMKYIKTVNYLSEKAKEEKLGKDNHIWNLKSYSADTVQFTLRNVYARLDVRTLLNPNEDSGIELDLINSTTAAQLRHRHGIDRLCKVPHRIGCVEIINTES